MDTPNPKRSCTMQNPNSFALAPRINQSDLDSTISSFVLLSDSPSIGCSFDRVLGQVLSSASGASGDDSVQDLIIERTQKHALLLHESAKHYYRKRATLHNYNSWPLPPDLTIKVFSMLDTKSAFQASACCTMFNRYAMDPSCYTDIDLTTAFKHADDGVLSTLIHRVGNKLRSLKIGRATNDNSFAPLLTRSCLTPLVRQEYAWNLLRSLHIYHLPTMDIALLCSLLSICTNLTDLKIVGLDEESLDEVLESLQSNCPLIEHLFLDNNLKGVMEDSVIEAFVSNCPNLTSLTLVHFDLNDAMAQTLVKGFRKLKYIDLSNTTGIHGSFLRDLGHSRKDSPLETIILRDCSFLEERQVSEFLHTLIKGDFKFIRYIDVSKNDGSGSSTFKPSNLPLEMLKEYRPQVTFVADFFSVIPRLEDSGTESEEDIGCHIYD